MRQSNQLLISAIFLLLIFVGYMWAGNTFCPIENNDPNLNWLLRPQPNYNKSEWPQEDKKSTKKEAYRYQGWPQPVFVPYSIEQTATAGEHAHDAHTKRNGWLTKFFCESKITDALLVVFTVALVLATIWLVSVTKQLWETAEQADRPHLIMSNISITGMGTLPNENGEVSLNVSYAMINYGKSPAILEEFGWCISCCKNADDEDVSIIMEVPFVIAPQAGFGSRKPTPITVGRDFISEFGEKDKYIFAFCAIRYRGANI